MEEPEDIGSSTKRRRVAAACETCKRRKERCDGVQPCGRCRTRGVEAECSFAMRTRHSNVANVKQKTTAETSVSTHGDLAIIHDHAERNTPSVNHEQEPLAPQSPSDSPLQHSRLIRDQKGRYMFIGDSANLSFLQTIRRLVEESVGSCSFVDDPLRYLMVEASPEGQPTWLNPSSQCVPPHISLSEAQYLVQRYSFATNCVLDLFDEATLLEHLPAWVDGQWTDSAIPSPIYYLVLAIGSQTCPENKDAAAETFFTYGRYLTAQSFMEDASIRTVQSYALITMYLLGACRRNAAFMYLGIAVRAAYAIGLHRKEVAASFSPEEFQERERLWKVMRILDLFMSASLGRPPSTAETRNTQEEQDYSASTDLCAVFEKILTDIYAKRKISTDALSRIGAHHRKWASQFFQGLATDKIEPVELVNGGSLPNIGLLHVKEAYYWTIILLTRPFLTESVVIHAKRAKTQTTEAPGPCTASDADTNNKVLVHACVDSAIRTVDLLKVLLGCEGLPKRLPFVINSLFISALVLGFAYFGDLYQTFPLEQNLKIAHRLLSQFTHDAIAQRNATIIGYLKEACGIYFENRTAQNMDHQGRAVGIMFGQIHRLRSQVPSRSQTPNRVANNAHTADAGSAAQANAHHGENTTANLNLAAQQQSLSEILNYSYDFGNVEDFASMPYPVMTPRTLWFDAYDEHMPLFSTISNAGEYYSNIP